MTGLRRQKAAGTKRLLRWTVPVLAGLFLYGVAYLASGYIFDVWVATWALTPDVPAFIGLAVILFAVSRRIWAFLALLSLIVGIFFVGSAAKIGMLGRPIMPDDIYSVVALVRIMGWPGWVLIALPLAILFGLLVFNFRFSGFMPKAALSALVLVPIGAGMEAPVTLKAMDAGFVNHPWDQRENFTMRGPAIHILIESLRALASRRPAPGKEDVMQAIGRLRFAAGHIPAGAPIHSPAGKRNIHILLEESFWDPSPLLPDRLDKPLLDPRFYALWEETGRSQILSPTFSGGTANAEFELLCGFPVDTWAVKFEMGFNSAPCLPSILAAAGYRTVAAHPNEAGFWNRINAYRNLGFETFWSKSNFILDEMITWMLSDRSFHRQMKEKLAASADGRPVLDYQVTLYGHWVYDMVPERPIIVAIDPASPELGRFATTMHYKSIEMMDEIERLRRDDPDSLIIVYGDHLPNLGFDWGGYKNNGFFKGGWGDFDAAIYLKSRATPIIAIDGRNGPLKLGQIPLYRLNALILDRLGLRRPTIGGLVPLPSGLVIRPVPDTIIGIDGGNGPLLCNGGDSEGQCGRIQDWVRDTKLIAHDIFNGDGYALDILKTSSSVSTDN